MQFLHDSNLQPETLFRLPSQCLVMGFSTLSTPLIAALDQRLGGLLGRLHNAGELRAALGGTLLLHEPPGLEATRLLLVGLGDKPANMTRLRGAYAAAAKRLVESRCNQATWVLDGADGPVLQAAVLALGEAAYQTPARQTKPEPPTQLQQVKLVSLGSLPMNTDALLSQAQAIAEGITLCRDLGNLPGNRCTPHYLGQQALALAQRYPGVTAEVLEPAALAELGLHAFLAVAQGSAEPPRLIVLKYQGAPETVAPVVLVGKGVTFDAGGISIKPSQAMDEMKFDMCGAASVFGCLQAIAQMQLAVNLYGIIPACENLPDGQALKPGDVIDSLSGTSIEVLNTDAEGRLILCDALTYARRFSPAALIDVATLTGACIVALGHVHSGLFSHDEDLARELLEAAQRSGDGAWRMPLDDAYGEGLKSNVADLNHLGGGRAAGSITAACFLARFTEGLRWAHLDIAGTANGPSATQGATGRPVGLLCDWLLARQAD